MSQNQTRSAKNQSSSVKTTPKPEPELQLEPLPPDPSAEKADISITANVRARSLKFETVPNPSVVFSGQPARDTVWEAQRENLPTPVEPGVTYRDIGVRLKITSVFRDIDRIVAEALGEVPIPEDSKATATVTQVEPPVPANKTGDSSMAASPRSPSAATTRPSHKERP